MAKGLSKRAKQQKRKQKRALPKRVNTRDITYPSTFLDLPQELRDLIYKPSLAQEPGTRIRLCTQEVCYFNLTDEQVSPPPAASVNSYRNLSLLCKIVRSEVEETFFACNEFQVDLMSQETDSEREKDIPPDPVKMAFRCTFLRGVDDVLLSKLRRVVVLDTILWNCYPEGFTAEGSATFAIEVVGQGEGRSLKVRHLPESRQGEAAYVKFQQSDGLAARKASFEKIGQDIRRMSEDVFKRIALENRRLNGFTWADPSTDRVPIFRSYWTR